MGRTLENKQQIVEELKKLLGEAEMALVLDYQGLSIKEMSDLRTRLQDSNGVCKVTKNTLMRRAIDGDSVWSSLGSLLSGTNAFILVKGDIGGACKAVQAFQKETKKSETKGGLFEGKLCLRTRSKPLGSFLPRKCSWPRSPAPSTQLPPRLLWVSTRFPPVLQERSSSTPIAAKAERLRPHFFFLICC
jgi:large subunit ribosomal protein L10